MNMLSPKKTKFRKQFKGRIHGSSKGNYKLNYGSINLFVKTILIMNIYTISISLSSKISFGTWVYFLYPLVYL